MIYIYIWYDYTADMTEHIYGMTKQFLQKKMKGE